MAWACCSYSSTSTSHGIAHSTRMKILTHSTRISHIRNSVRPTFHLLWISHIRNSIRPTFHLLRISHTQRLSPNGRGRCFNFLGQTCPDPSVTLIRRTSVATNSDSPDSLARQILTIRRIHFLPRCMRGARLTRSWCVRSARLTCPRSPHLAPGV